MIQNRQAGALLTRTSPYIVTTILFTGETDKQGGWQHGHVSLFHYD